MYFKGNFQGLHLFSSAENLIETNVVSYCNYNNIILLIIIIYIDIAYRNNIYRGLEFRKRLTGLIKLAFLRFRVAIINRSTRQINRKEKKKESRCSL